MLINIKLDDSTAVKQKFHLADKFVVCLKNKDCDTCYRLFNPETKLKIGSVRFCENEYGLLKEGDEAIAEIHAGYLSVPWVSNATLVKMTSFEDLLRHLKSEDKLRFTQVKYFKEKGEIKESHFKEWEHKCATLKDHSCRLASYLYSINNNETQSLKLLNIGCDSGDSVACLGLYYSSESTPQEKDKYYKDLDRSCFQHNKIESCSALGSIRWNQNYKENYNTLMEIYKKVCSVKQDKDSCNYLDYLKKHPINMNK